MILKLDLDKKNQGRGIIVLSNIGLPTLTSEQKAILEQDLIPQEWQDTMEALRNDERRIIRKRQHTQNTYNAEAANINLVEYIKTNYPEWLI